VVVEGEEMENLSFSGGREPASVQDFDEIEFSVNNRLPESFKSHYLKWNGGMPSMDWFPAQTDFEPIWIHEFLHIQGKQANPSRDGSSVQSVYAVAMAKGLVPKNMLPFAIDPGGNFFCLDVADGSVSYWLNDVWDATLSVDANRVKAQRVLSDSFDDFLKALVSEDDAFR
jgi:cell wall assembly regulator SMI1